MDVKEALEACGRIIELIDDEVPEWARDKAPEFFEDVREKVVSVEETITVTADVTPAQSRAIENWEAGVRKLIK